MGSEFPTLSTLKKPIFLLRNYREVASYDINGNDADPFPRCVDQAGLLYML